jgi:hypothetical protein
VLHIGRIIEEAERLFPDLRGKNKDGLSAALNYRTINMRARAHTPGDFDREDEWNRAPAFIKVGRGVYRRLSEKEREQFQRLWRAGNPILRKPEFSVDEWDSLMES